jgi:hypothetical protein
MNVPTRLAAVLGVVLVVQGCAVRAGPGRLRVAIPVPIPMPVIRVPVYTEPAVVVAPSPVVVAPAAPPHASPEAPMPTAQGGYPSAGPTTPAAGANLPTAGASSLGVVRSIEGLGSPGRESVLRVTVLMDNQTLRRFDVPHSDWRVGQRVRIEGDRLVR